CFCGPCFGAGDVPANFGLSIRHSTRNFPNRDGSKPREGQMAAVALMDARSIAVSARRGGIITPADEYAEKKTYSYVYDPSIYEKTVYDGVGRPKPEEKLILGPNITDWPPQPELAENLLIEVASYITDEVTTTDELIPSGETSSYRSNPLRLAEFALSRKDPGYVGRMKRIGKTGKDGLTALLAPFGLSTENTGFGGAVAARKPGDGSAREQAASCQRVLGGNANVAVEYATKRYRSNLINWGMLPFVLRDPADFEKFETGSLLYVPGVRETVRSGAEECVGYLLRNGERIPVALSLGRLTEAERDILLAGCLINYYGKDL
ncbi:MAG: hydratase, partial [Clostridia bacterium]|nr:hydratase [Clostridia bacterium]